LDRKTSIFIFIAQLVANFAHARPVMVTWVAATEDYEIGTPDRLRELACGKNGEA
jgi:hypothetical protein